MIFVTFPRSGVNFITRAIEYQTGILIEYQHTFYAVSGWGQTNRLVDNSEDYIITIVRDPAESIASWISMQYENNDSPLIKNGHIKIIKAIQIPNYLNLYRKLFSHTNVIFIDYNDLKDNLDLILNKLYEILKLDIINYELNAEYIKNTMNSEAKEKQYLQGSQNYSKYQEVRASLSNIDLSKCYDLYHQALEKCIKI